MKKFIVAALSVILGTFGYTIVDTVIEHRVSNLESCVSSLEAVVESYHKVFETTTANTTRRTTTNPTTTANTTRRTTTTITTSTATSNNNLNAGDFIPEYNSQRKFLLRKYREGGVVYISPDSFNGYVPTTTSPNAYEDFYLYVTDASFQLTDIYEKSDTTSWYNQNYDVVSSVKSQTLYDVKITLKGYTDSCFNNHTVDFDFSAWYSYFPEEYNAYSFYTHLYKKSIVSNNICSDGSFEYVAIYTFKNKPPANLLFGINSIKVDWHNATTAAPTTTTTTEATSTTKYSTTYPTSTTAPTTSQGVNVGGVIIDENGYIVVN